MLKLLLILSVFIGASISYADVTYDFRLSYEQARSHFVELAENFVSQYPQSKHLELWVNQEEDLSANVLYVPSKSKNKIILMTAGIHGAEAPLGSVAVRTFIKDHISEYVEKDIGLLIVHSANPYGHRYLRRVNRNNVDLNRNFLLKDSDYNISNDSYDAFYDILNPDSSVANTGTSFYSLTFRLLSRMLLKGMSVASLRQASVGGQYQHSPGVYFGGKKRQPETILLTDLFRSKIEPYKDVLHLDFHTGLGERSELHLILSARLTDKELKSVEDIFPSPSKNYVLTTSKDDGFYDVSGGLPDINRKLFPNPKEKRILAVTAEFGTVGLSTFDQLKTLHWMVQENQGYHHGYVDTDVESQVMIHFSELFNPSAKEWQTKVLGKIRFLFGDSLKKFSNQPLSD